MSNGTNKKFYKKFFQIYEKKFLFLNRYNALKMISMDFKELEQKAIDFWYEYTKEVCSTANRKITPLQEPGLDINRR